MPTRIIIALMTLERTIGTAFTKSHMLVHGIRSDGKCCLSQFEVTSFGDSTFLTFRDAGAQITEDEMNQGLEEIRIFKKWVDEHVLIEDVETHSRPIIVLPLGRAGPNYRDEAAAPR